LEVGELALVGVELKPALERDRSRLAIQGHSEST
jgi:hypothetical protein